MKLSDIKITSNIDEANEYITTVLVDIVLKLRSEGWFDDKMLTPKDTKKRKIIKNSNKNIV